MTDVRRELALINKHVHQHNRESGEYIVWFEFKDVGSDGGTVYDDVYDMGVEGIGGRSYEDGVVIPTIYVEELEDQAFADQDARQPMQNLRVTILYEDMYRAGVSEPHEYRPHLNDMFSYQARFYKVHTYQARGRLGSEVIVSVNGFEVYVDQEFAFDEAPGTAEANNLPWPTSFPSVV